MAMRVGSEIELRQLLGKKPEKLAKLPRGAARNQSSAHTQLVKSCIDWLKLKGIFCWKQNTGGVQIGTRFVKFSEPGMPDILGAFPVTATLFGIEAKTGEGRQRPAQREMEQRFTRAHALYLVVRSIEDLEKWFK